MLSRYPSSTCRRTAFLVVIVLLLAACGTQSSTSAVGETSGSGSSSTTASADSVAPPTTGVASRSNAPRKIAYGPSAFQYGVLHLPDEPATEPRPVAVLIHGGFWTNGYGLELMAFQAADLNDRGWAVWNIEYRRSGDPDGGGENTLADVAEALRTLDTVAEDEQLDLDNTSTHRGKPGNGYSKHSRPTGLRPKTHQI